MGLARTAYRSTNFLLGKLGLELLPLSRDYDARLESPWALEAMFRRLGGEIEAWLGRQTLFVAQPFDVAEGVATLYADYLDSPFRGKGGGSRFNNLAWLYAIARAYRPTVMIDSGTYLGASAWALRQGSDAPLYSFDIDMSRIAQKVDASYVEADWTTHRFDDEDLSRSLCYFDDHVDQAKRLLEAKAAGCRLALFDDDFPVTGCVEMAHGGFALPKVEFVLDETLRGQASLDWFDGRRRQSWPIDAAYLDAARATIAATERLPNTSVITGIHQTPYRLVKLAD
jgi:hypothetical protein